MDWMKKSVEWRGEDKNETTATMMMMMIKEKRVYAIPYSLFESNRVRLIYKSIVTLTIFFPNMLRRTVCVISKKLQDKMSTKNVISCFWYVRASDNLNIWIQMYMLSTRANTDTHTGSNYIQIMKIYW